MLPGARAAGGGPERAQLPEARRCPAGRSLYLGGRRKPHYAWHLRVGVRSPPSPGTAWPVPGLGGGSLLAPNECQERKWVNKYQRKVPQEGLGPSSVPDSPRVWLTGRGAGARHPRRSRASPRPAPGWQVRGPAAAAPGFPGGWRGTLVFPVSPSHRTLSPWASFPACRASWAAGKRTGEVASGLVVERGPPTRFCPTLGSVAGTVRPESETAAQAEGASPGPEWGAGGASEAGAAGLCSRLNCKSVKCARQGRAFCVDV